MNINCIDLFLCFLCSAAAMTGTSMAAAAVVKKLDGEAIPFDILPDRRQWRWGMFLCAVNSTVITFLAVQHCEGKGSQSFQQIVPGTGSLRFMEILQQCFLLGVMAGCLVFACFTDLRSCKVYDFTWWTALAVGAVMFWPGVCLWPEGLSQLTQFFLMQELFFSRFYGRADSHAFCACALVGNAFHMGMREYLYHMSAAFVILTVVQVFQHNVGINGKLKKPVPFLPYITVTFWLLLICQCMKYIGVS